MNDRSQSAGMAMIQYLCLLAMIVLYGLQILARTSRIEQEITCLAQGYTVIHSADSTAMFDHSIVCMGKR